MPRLWPESCPTQAFTKSSASTRSPHGSPTHLFRNLPNFFTTVRIILVPFVAAALWHRRYWLALLLLFAAGVTDGIDGWMARRFGWLSRLGAMLDPAADKALLITLYLVLGLTSVVPLWLTALVLGRDIFIVSMVAVGLAFTTVRNFPPSVAGKISTIVQISAA